RFGDVQLGLARIIGDADVVDRDVAADAVSVGATGERAAVTGFQPGNREVVGGGGLAILMQGFEVVGDSSQQGDRGGFLIGFLVPLFGIGKGVHGGDLNFVRGRGVGAQVELALVVTGNKENIVARGRRNDVAIHFLTIAVGVIRRADEFILP